MNIKSSFIYSLLAVALMGIIALAFFYPDDIDGRVLQQHDIQQGIANGQEGKSLSGKDRREHPVDQLAVRRHA